MKKAKWVSSKYHNYLSGSFIQRAEETPTMGLDR